MRGGLAFSEMFCAGVVVCQEHMGIGDEQDDLMS
jgi:hypothetical protein